MNFQARIAAFNCMYRLPVSAVPTLTAVGVGHDAAAKRLEQFKNILGEELNEIDEIIDALKAGVPALIPLVMLADLLGDIQVYCASEMAKFGLPLDTVLTVIMDSNASKLGTDGLPIYDERGKVMKGPGYWKPEPRIEQELSTLMMVQYARPGKQGMMGGATVASINPTSDDVTERMIQQKGKTAPRVVPAAIQAEVVSCHYFTAADGVTYHHADIVPPSLSLLTFCVLVLKNGFTVTGESACASPENFDAEIGQKIARENAEQKIWPLLGFRLKDQLNTRVGLGE